MDQNKIKTEKNFFQSNQRRKTPLVKVGHISLGNGQPIVIQAMTNTLTSDVEATVKQIQELTDAGAELVRITINDEASAKAVPYIKEKLLKSSYQIPIIGDFHYNGHILLKKFPELGQLLAKYRINHGNIGKGQKHNKNFAFMIETALKNNKPIRIGVNWGSLDQELFTKLMEKNALSKLPKPSSQILHQALITSAITSAKFAENLGLNKDKIVLSIKLSSLPELVKVNFKLAKKCDYALHLGLTEAGSGIEGVSASAGALAILLNQGIGDTIRISLTPEPGISRTQEVRACKALLQALNLRFFQPTVTSCPGCGRTNSQVFIELTQKVKSYLQQQMPVWKNKYPGVEKLHIAIMGCIVNGPGESKFADIGLSLPGNLEKPNSPVYLKGELFKILNGDKIYEQFLEILNDFIIKNYSN